MGSVNDILAPIDLDEGLIELPNMVNEENDAPEIGNTKLGSTPQEDTEEEEKMPIDKNDIHNVLLSPNLVIKSIKKRGSKESLENKGINKSAKDTDMSEKQPIDSTSAKVESYKNEEDEMNCNGNKVDESCTKSFPNPDSFIESHLEYIYSTLNKITNMEELEKAKVEIKYSLDMISLEYNSMNSQISILKCKPIKCPSQEGSVSIPPATESLPPSPPPPPPPPPLLLSPRNIINDEISHENFGSMLNMAKRKISPDENGAANANEIDYRLKNNEINDVQVDIMKQLRNTLNNRKTRTSLKDKYKKLS